MRKLSLACLGALLLLGAPARSALARDAAAATQGGYFPEEKTAAVVVGLLAGAVVGSYLTQPTITGALLGAAIAAWWYDEKDPAASFLPKRLGGSAPAARPRPLSVIIREAPDGADLLVLRAADSTGGGRHAAESDL